MIRIDWGKSTCGFPTWGQAMMEGMVERQSAAPTAMSGVQVPFRLGEGLIEVGDKESAPQRARGFDAHVECIDNLRQLMARGSVRAATWITLRHQKNPVQSLSNRNAKIAAVRSVPLQLFS